MKELDKAFDDLSDVINNPKRVLHVAIVIDESGSMNSLKPFVVKTFNDQLEVLKKEADDKLEVRASVLTFSYPERITFLRWETDIHDIEPLTDGEYKPDGGTALFDAIGMMMDRLREVDDYLSENSAFLLMIITDGEENSSRRYGYKQIKSLLDEMEATKRWTITYYGSEPKAMQENFHIHAGNTMTFNAQDMASGVYAMGNMSSTKRHMDNIKMGAMSSSSYYVDTTTDGLVDEKAKDVLKTITTSSILKVKKNKKK
jgi:hypothetical protein